MAERVYVALGSNLGDRAGHLAQGRARLAALPRTRLVRASRVEETAPLGPIAQGPYLNQMVLLETELEPVELLRHLHAIEAERGRVRTVRWGPRTLDLDVVRYGERRSEEHTSELQSQSNLVCRLLLEKKKKKTITTQQSTKQNTDDQHHASL